MVPEVIVIEAAVLALVAGASIALDRRYRARRKAARGSWQRTQERFTAQTGEREYRPAGKTAR